MRAKLRALLERVPFPVLVPFIVASYYLSVFLLLLFWPLRWLYGVGLRILAYRRSQKDGKDVLIVRNMANVPNHYVDTLLSLLGNRAMFLDYAERKQWRRSEISVQLFELFGPGATAEIFIPRTLPTVIVLNGYRSPKRFTFGSASKAPEMQLEKLKAELLRLNLEKTNNL